MADQREYSRRHRTRWKTEAPTYTRQVKHGTLEALTLPGEQWAIVEGTLGRYQVSSLGRVIGPQGKILKPSTTYKGYLTASVYQNGSRDRPVHRLVAEAFIPNHLALPCVNHKSGVKTENGVLNLEWATHQHNTQHAVDNKLKPSRKGQPARKLTEAQVRRIRKAYVRGSAIHGQKALAKKHKVSISTVGDLLRGKTWGSP